ncbi:MULTISPECIES: uracil-DNA glycosylase [unclassified Variovorax]|uniref:uracil-DNA glycosylase n=1 Tax=unclassified Variovorax TaxID=663243 RepID=UPI0025774FCA|nr:MULTISPECIES: uracil-DNA glycosylase [unclassified Variovorax]MDM0091103.1 uracil-DNA glycosylase [Variovorax sp. J22G40]MDM0148895.1 uracil-DNA glycosylase [Variovorax sp. J2P1-31]
MNTGSTMNLDARQRAMLDEMGIKVWWPSAAPAVVEAAPAAVAEVPAPARAVREAPAPMAAPVAPPAPVRAPAVQAPAPAAAPAARPHGAAVLVEAPRLLHGGVASPGGGWLIVADMPPEADGRHGEPFAGDAGRLLDNMLRALQLQGGERPVHLMRTHRGVASGRDGSPEPLDHSFAAHAQALAPRVVLAMGPLAAQSLLQSSDPLGRLRGRAVPMAAWGGLPVVATYHPAYLLRNPADKARAWADLCLAAAQLAQA